MEFGVSYLNDAFDADSLSALNFDDIIIALAADL
jgi:hypothetical protein